MMTLTPQELDRDIPKVYLLFLSFPLLFGLSWAMWFWQNPIFTYAISTDVSFSSDLKKVMDTTQQDNTTRYTLRSNRELRAEFPAYTHVEVGEEAIVQLNQYTYSGSIVEMTSHKDKVVVQLVVNADDMPLAALKAAQVWVVTGVVTPSDLVLQE